jgi:hypothetical protein
MHILNSFSTKLLELYSGIRFICFLLRKCVQKVCTGSGVSDWRHLIAALGVTCRAGGGT